MDFSLAMFLGCVLAFCVVLFTEVMFISHIVLLAWPPSRQVTVYTNDYFDCNAFADKHGFEQ